MRWPRSSWSGMARRPVAGRGAAGSAFIYYWLPRWAEAMWGFSEAVYRLPSVLAMGITLLLVARLAARLIHPRAGWFAVFACLALNGIDYQAADARPYGLGTCVAAAGVLFLVRWLDTARRGRPALRVVRGAALASAPDLRSPYCRPLSGGPLQVAD